ncbi:phosphotransferase [Paenibacillus gansuensis]|uniref:Phosphotransferase n=1 Tax=Paenibacillus gansuensis TaxID=306542 RepID=A0ABW5PCV5_9BACL
MSESSKATEQEIRELAAQYALGPEVEIRLESSGMNNTTRFLYAGDQVYVLRIYDNHKDIAKVQFEHEVMLRLGEMKLPFGVPKLVQTESGATYARSSAGKLSALFEKAPGTRPSSDTPMHIEAMGKAAGQLVEALSRVKSSVPSSYLPYYEIYDVHPLLTRDKLPGAAALPQVPEVASDTAYLLDEIQRLEESIPGLKSLPVQIVHSDLVFSNALIYGDYVTILDFEFATLELRAMELAVLVSELIREEVSNDVQRSRIMLLFQGYSSSHQLEDREIVALAALVKLRFLVVYVHFLGRYLEGLDGADVLVHQIARAAYGCRWFELHNTSWEKLIDQL